MGAKYSAIVYVHGIGRHDAHENAGKFMEQLKLAEERLHNDGLGVLRNFKAKSQFFKTIEEPTLLEFVGFSHLNYCNPAPWQEVAYTLKHHYRMFEVAWSPLTKAGAEPFRVFAWLLSLGQIPKGYRVSDFRQKPIIRIARLHWSRLTGSASLKTFYWARLLGKYQRFRGTPGRLFEKDLSPRTFGSVENLASFARGVPDRNGRPPLPTSQAVEEATKSALSAWILAKLPCEISVAAIARTAMWSTIFITGCSILLSYGLASLLNSGLAALVGGVFLIAILTVAIMMLRSARYFFGRVLSDVRIWSGWRQNDEFNTTRVAILNRCRAVLSEVARDPDCDRIVIICHSLGTAIAYDTLREIGRYNRAANATKASVIPMFKLDRFITLGSPIDKLTYLFEAKDAGSYRAADWHEQLRGDLSCDPFHDGRRARVTWDNYWDSADPVSDPLFTPLGGKIDGGRFVTAGINNLRVENTRWFGPHSHIAYLDNSVIMDRIFRAIFGVHSPLVDEPISQDLQTSKARRWTKLGNRVVSWASMSALFFGLASIVWHPFIFAMAFSGAVSIFAIVIIWLIVRGKLGEI